MRSINKQFAQVLLDASVEAFLGFVRNQNKFIKGLDNQYFLDDKYQIDKDISVEEFDKMSYQIFRSGLEFIKDRNTINKITQKIGQKIFKFFCKDNRFKLLGNSDDIKSWQADFEKLIRCFVSVGYFEDGKISWQGFNEKIWQKEGNGRFLYQMKNPAILSSATKLFNKYGIAQHYSSRTIVALFVTYKINAQENEDFNPNKFNKNLVLEYWQLKKM